MFRREPHGQEHMGWLHRPRTTRGAGRHPDPLQIQGEHQRLRLGPGKGQAADMRKAPLPMAVPQGSSTGHQRRFQPISEPRDAVARLFQVGVQKRRSARQADGAGHVLGAAAARALLPSPVDQGDHLGPPPDIKGTDPFGAVDLVPRDGEEIRTQRLDMDGDLSESLDRIGVEQDVPLAAHLGYLGDREEHSRLVVGVHEADQNRARPDRSSHVVRIQHTLAVHRQSRDRAPLTLQVIGGMEDGVMLDRRDDEM